jgi:hypothetical protein
MRRQLATIAAFVTSLLSCVVHAQVTPPLASGDGSPYFGRPVTHPEGLSGLWEISNGHGGAVGIHLILTTSVSWDVPTLSGAQQSWQRLDVGVYERKGATIQLGEQNYFSDSSRGGTVSFDEGHLELHFISRFPDDESIDVDLVQQAGDRWTGRLHRRSFDSRVTLSRPSAGIPSKDLIIGTWAGRPGVPHSCVHIGSQVGEEFVGWMDSFPRIGPVQPATPRISMPKTAWLVYGRLVKVRLEEGGQISIESNEHGPCCFPWFAGKLTKEGTVIEGVRRGPYSFKDASLQRITGDSCLNPDSVDR